MVYMYVRWHRPVILAYRRLRQKDQKFQASLSYTVREHVSSTILKEIPIILVPVRAQPVNPCVNSDRLDCHVSGSCPHLYSAGYDHDPRRSQAKTEGTISQGGGGLGRLSESREVQIALSGEQRYPRPQCP